MTPPVFQLLFIAIGLFIAIKSISGGSLILILPLGWFVADGMPSSIAIPIWLLSSLVFGLLLLNKLESKNVRIKRRVT